MAGRLLLRLKAGLTRVGGVVPSGAHAQVRAAVNYLAIGRWMKDHQYDFDRRVSSREAVWSEMTQRVRNSQVLYLEFGVFEGRATRFWSERLTHPDSVIHGFDSFEGLPDEGGPWSKGQFAVDGHIPEIADPRVTFFKGWFDETLPTYVPPEHDVLVLNMDADLYASTRCALQHVGSLVRPGTLIYFDEMNHIDHEPKAFAEFLESSGRRFRPLVADRTLAHVAFECIE